jgi:putative ABC transport system permease protein
MNYAFKAVNDNENYDSQLGLVGSGDENDPAQDGVKGLNFSKFIGNTSKQFTWYPNDEVYTYNQQTGSYFYRPTVTGSQFETTTTIDFGGQSQTVNYTIDLGDIDTKAADKVDLSVKLILQKKDDISYGCLDAGLYYTNAFTKHIRTSAMSSKIVQSINNSDITNSNGEKALSGLPYTLKYTKIDEDTYSTTTGAITASSSILEMMMSGLGNGSAAEQQSEMLKVTASMLGGGDMPTSIYFYPVDFDNKTLITDYLDEWNTMCSNSSSYTYVNEDGTSVTETLGEANKITYTDTVGIIINMINTMIQMITIALVAFTALSLVVSTVMIGIITYVSVVERVKEIGILRAVGARKKDIKRLFNAETFIIGLVAGVFGILITYILSLIINVVVYALAGVWGIAALPWWQALIMIVLSVVLTLISGLIPASAAAKKDPVVALRTE